jgi:hypothetical protein
MVYRKKTLDEANPAPEQPVLEEQKNEYPIKKLVIDNNTLLYKIDGEMVDVHIYLDVGLKYEDQEKKKRQIPELKMSIERDYKKCAGMTVDQMMALMSAGYRPTKKWASSFVTKKDGNTIIPNNFNEAVDNLQRSFNETHVDVFHFGVDLEILKKSNIADIFTRACNGQVPIEGLKTW